MPAGQWIYIPDDDPKDKAIRIGKTQVPSALGFQHKDFVYTIPGQGALGHVHEADPATLVVYGHGNLGAGIGSHKRHFGAGTLCKKLMADGLKPRQSNLTIYLWACNTGVDMGRVFWNKDSYAKRFAKQLAEQRFDNTYVVGFVGFVAATGKETVLRANVGTGQNDETASPLGIDSADGRERRALYRVSAGGYALVKGQTWTSSLNVVTRNVDIIRAA